jgi:hypothetical protein
MDSSRTFNYLAAQMINISPDSLPRILNAYSILDPELGYTQGMNFLAAMLLLSLDEEEAFWSFYSLMNRHRLKRRLIFTTGFPKLLLLSKVVDYLIGEKFPEIKKLMNQTHLPSVSFIPMWFMTIFISPELDFDLISLIFDLFLAYWIPPLISFGMAMIEINKEPILSQEIDFLEIMTFSRKSPLMSDMKVINEVLNKHWITSNQMSRLIKNALTKEEYSEYKNLS